MLHPMMPPPMMIARAWVGRGLTLLQLETYLGDRCSAALVFVPSSHALIVNLRKHIVEAIEERIAHRLVVRYRKVELGSHGIQKHAASKQA